MNKLISAIQHEVQDRNSVAWKKRYEYVDHIAVCLPSYANPFTHGRATTCGIIVCSILPLQ